MTTQHYQAPALPINVPSKAPAPAGLYPVSRVSGSPPDLSDTSTTAGSRTSAGFSYGSGSLSGDYESSSASYSGVDVVDVLSDRMQNTFDPTPLDKGLAMQAQTSGQMNAKQRELLELQALAQRRLKGVRSNFSDGIKVARETKRDLEWTQKRVKISAPLGTRGDPPRSAAKAILGNVRDGLRALKTKAESVHPEEYRRATRKYTYDDN